MPTTPYRPRQSPTPRLNLDADEISQRATDEYSSLREKFQATRAPVDFDFREHCGAWTARGDHLTHRIHRYPARLTPYIPLFFLGVKDIAVLEGNLLDPFAGCGTVLVESLIHPAHPMHPIGYEINPLARLIAKVKTTPLNWRAVADAWKRISTFYSSDHSRAGLSDFPNKRHWFTNVVELRLARLLRAIGRIRESDIHDFFLVAASSVVRQVALADPRVSVPVKLNAGRYCDSEVRRQVASDIAERAAADVFSIFEETVNRNLARLRAWASEARLQLRGTAICGADARTFVMAPYEGRGRLGDNIPGLPRNIDLILTSPPYANAQRYTRSLRLELFVLGFTSDSKHEGQLDRLQVGTERVAEPDWEEMSGTTGVESADCAIGEIRRVDRYRAAVVGKYVRDMKQVIGNCYGVLNSGGHAVLVVGNNCVRGTIVNNADILTEIGEMAGLQLVLRLKNKIPSRGLLTKRHPTAGVITHEHVLVLRKPRINTMV